MQSQIEQTEIGHGSGVNPFLGGRELGEEEDLIAGVFNSTAPLKSIPKVQRCLTLITSYLCCPIYTINFDIYNNYNP